ncbi:MAG: hypothetical protein ACLP07_05020 [Terracidiphilus sp.]
MPLMGGLAQIARYCGIGIVAATPFADPILPNNLHVLPAFPPLGGTDLLLKSFASLTIFACGILASHQSKRRGASVKYRHGFLTAVAGLAVYATLTIFFVARLDNPDSHTYEFRSVGFWRTELGRTDPKLKNAPAVLAVEIAGTEEWAIEMVWEPWSIYLVRFFLFVSYLVTLGSFNYGFGAVKIQLLPSSSPQ